jgi:hypothetical protein
VADSDDRDPGSFRDLLAQQVVTVGGHSITLGVSEHIDEESLERYALGRSLASESEWIEEHLLVCGPCREALVILESLFKFRLKTPSFAPLFQLPPRSGIICVPMPAT